MIKSGKGSIFDKKASPLNFLCHGSSGCKFLTNKKKRSQGFNSVATSWTLYRVDPLLTEWQSAALLLWMMLI